MEWISVKERLPEFGVKVLVTDGEDIDLAVHYRGTKRHPDWCSCTRSCLDVTHWTTPLLPREIEEEMRKFTEGFAYKKRDNGPAR
jgi:hypothetical protein